MTIEDKTIYEKIHFIYCRNSSQFLNTRVQKFANLSLDDAWAQLEQAEKSSIDVGASSLEVTQSADLMFFELRKGDSVIGLATEVFKPSPFETWFLATILRNGVLSFSSNASAKGHQMAVAITEVFETTIKNSASVDRWEEGRDGFIENVRFFTSRQIPVEAVLPAFPCKSFNRDKAARGEPDFGEELAVHRIIDFVNKVNKLYAPGVQFFIVSDGHVFSDCINVDDDVVDTYTEQLKEIYHRVKPDGFSGISFKGLNDCFKSPTKNVVAQYLDVVDIDHHLGTKVDAETELNRKILMLGCDDNAELLKEQIHTPGHARLYLYRGFNKFMYEDLINTPKAQELSKKKFKKLISQVSFEMIRRNDAYSNLVELVFPFHLRLSIHAHHNAGPKFGIRLLDPKLCCTGLHDQEEEDRLLHIPTPWHNAVFKISDREKLVVAPAKLADQYEKDNEYTGGWDEKKRLFVFERVSS